MKRSCLLVVDTCVIHSAGETQHPVSSACRETLLSILEICHRVVVTKELFSEWRNHASAYSRKWMRSMAARNKFPRMANCELRLDISALEKSDREAINKDRCLLEAAFSSEKIIITHDRSLQKSLAKCRDGKKVLKEIMWISPIEKGPEAMQMLSTQRKKTQQA